MYDRTKNCPECGITWEGRKIPEGLFSTGRYETMEEAEKGAVSYGWTPENQLRFGANVMGIETYGYDGVSYWQCMNCNSVFDRFTGERKHGYF